MHNRIMNNLDIILYFLGLIVSLGLIAWVTYIIITM